MKQTCPRCHYNFDDQAQSKAGKARWKGTKKKDRSAEMRRVAMIRHHGTPALSLAELKASSIEAFAASEIDPASFRRELKRARGK